MDEQIRKQKHILVVFVEPMLYGLDLIEQVYKKTEYDFLYVYCYEGLTGKDRLKLPENSSVCNGSKQNRKEQIYRCFELFTPDFVILNGYVGWEQVCCIKLCQKKMIPYAIESDTPLRIPDNKLKALVKKYILKKRLANEMCYGFPGGTLQKENLMYYGIPEKRNFIMPMSVCEERIMTVYNQLPDKSSLKKEMMLGTRKVLLFVGRFIPEKNLPVLIEAFSLLEKERTDVTLVLVGDGVERNSMMALAEEKSVSQIRFVGHVSFPDIVKYYKIADSVVLPSCSESWGFVINEALVMNVPVVVSDRVGCRVDLVNTGNNGFIFENDNAKDLCEKMKNILDLKYEGNLLENWNYTRYLESFINGVESICGQ